MTIYNEIEKRIIEKAKRGEPIHGYEREIWIEISLREMDKR